MDIFSKLASILSGKDNNSRNNAPAPAPEPNLPWGRTMPKEENQFSYPGAYYEYFGRLFRQAFPMFDISEKAVPNKRYKYPPDPRRPFSLRSVNRQRYNTVFTFSRMGNIALVVEIVHEKFKDDRVRRGYATIGVPYLRFYYDHRGWWNTRSYVTGRVKEALTSRPEPRPAERMAPQAAVRPQPVPTAPRAPQPMTPRAAATAAPQPVSPRVTPTVAPQPVTPRVTPPTAPRPVGRFASGRELSWGPDMPFEENQYSYNGKYYEYFRHVFREEFGMYDIQEQGRFNNCFRGMAPRPVGRFAPPTPVRQGEQIATVYTFNRGPRTVLIVEVLSEKSQTNRLRDECKRRNVPYLRFYHNHKNWWNTRSYVVDRVKQALGLSR
ncbi:MAG: hypothetical protein II920_05565 [Clostridia bacterium]|nr:hypothetical protein [Clostridia bacterium]